MIEPTDTTDLHRKLVDDLDAAAKLARELGLTTAAYFAEMARDEARANG